MAPTRTVSTALAGGFALAFACLLLILAVASGPASAETLEQKQAAARDRIEQTSAAIESDRADLEAAEAEAAAAASKEADLAGLIANGEDRSADLATRLEAAEQDLAKSRKRLRRARALLADRLVSMYMSGETPDTLGLVLGSGDFGELATSSEYLRSIQNADTRLASRVAQLRAELSGKVDGLGEAKQAVDEHTAALNSAYSEISAARMAAESTAATLASANADREAQIGSLKSEIGSWQKQIEKQEQVTAEQAEVEVEQNLGGPYSIPTYIVMCESGGNYSAVNSSSGAGGAYQIMPATWEAYGGTGLPNEASKAEQDRIAALIWADVGSSAWTCA